MSRYNYANRSQLTHSHSFINVLAVGAFGEAEFWLSGGKVILIFMLFFFTFVTMVGGNPQGDAYGFRNWTNGGAFREYITTGDLGRFEGFLGGLTSAVFTVVGPEYISIVAAEAIRPRTYIKAAFKMVYVRFGLFCKSTNPFWYITPTETLTMMTSHRWSLGRWYCLRFSRPKAEGCRRGRRG